METRKFCRFWPLVAGLALLPVFPARAQDVERILEILREVPDPAEVSPRPRGAPRKATTVDQPGGKTSQGEATGDTLPRFYLRNGNILRGRPIQEILPVETPFGTLRIPFAELVEVRFSLEIDPEVEADVAAAVKMLGDDDFEVRQKASDRLLDLGIDAIRSLRVAVKSEDEEVRLRAEKLLEQLEIQALNEIERSDFAPLLQDRDRISTLNFSIDGKVRLERIEIESPYGRLAVPRRDLARIHVRKRGQQSVSVTIEPKHQIPGSWLRTSLQVDRGEPLHISASGNMGVPDWGEFGGPAGVSRTSRTHSGYRCLALVGKIGERGAFFLIGPEFGGKAAARGVLYLGIIPFRYTASVVGSFEVKIEIR